MTKSCGSVVSFEFEGFGKSECVYRCSNCDEVYGHGKFVIIVLIDDNRHLLLAESDAECRCSIHKVPRFYRSPEEVTLELISLKQKLDRFKNVEFMKLEKIELPLGVRH